VSAYLLDTQAFLWYAADPAQLSSKALDKIENGGNELWVSIASLWEISIKLSIGQLTLKERLEKLVDKQISINRIQLLAITHLHTFAVQKLPFHHRDPFDRLLVAQATLEKFPIISSDLAFDSYRVARIW
jgi:PIN domain nuclease of toxin-antitoxin system